MGTTGRSVALAMAIENRAQGDRIATLRDRRGLSQEELARRVNVSKGAVQNWESGRGIRGENLRRVAEVLDVTIEEITGQAETPNPFEVGAQIDAMAQEFRDYVMELKTALDNNAAALDDNAAKLDALIGVLLEPSALSEFEAAVRDAETLAARNGERDASESARAARHRRSASG